MKKGIIFLTTVVITVIATTLLVKPVKKLSEKLMEERTLSRLAKKYGNLY